MVATTTMAGSDTNIELMKSPPSIPPPKKNDTGEQGTQGMRRLQSESPKPTPQKPRDYIEIPHSFGDRLVRSQGQWRHSLTGEVIDPARYRNTIGVDTLNRMAQEYDTWEQGGQQTESTPDTVQEESATTSASVEKKEESKDLKDDHPQDQTGSSQQPHVDQEVKPSSPSTDLGVADTPRPQPSEPIPEVTTPHMQDQEETSPSPSTDLGVADTTRPQPSEPMSIPTTPHIQDQDSTIGQNKRRKGDRVQAGEGGPQAEILEAQPNPETGNTQYRVRQDDGMIRWIDDMDIPPSGGAPEAQEDKPKPEREPELDQPTPEPEDLHTNSYTSAVERGRGLVDQGDYGSAREHYESTLDQQGVGMSPAERQDLHFRIGDTYARSGDIEGVMRSVDQEEAAGADVHSISASIQSAWQRLPRKTERPMDDPAVRSRISMMMPYAREKVSEALKKRQQEFEKEQAARGGSKGYEDQVGFDEEYRSILRIGYGLDEIEAKIRRANLESSFGGIAN